MSDWWVLGKVDITVMGMVALQNSISRCLRACLALQLFLMALADKLTADVSKWANKQHSLESLSSLSSMLGLHKSLSRCLRACPALLLFPVAWADKLTAGMCKRVYTKSLKQHTHCT